MAMLEVKDLEVYYGMIQAIKGISFDGKIITAFVFDTVVESYYNISSPTSERNILFIIKTFLCVSTGCFVRAFPIETCCIRFVYKLSRSRNKFIYFIAVNGISGSKRSFSGRFTTFHRNIDTDFIDTGNSNITSEGCFCSLIVVLFFMILLYLRFYIRLFRLNVQQTSYAGFTANQCVTSV